MSLTSASGRSSTHAVKASSADAATRHRGAGRLRRPTAAAHAYRGRRPRPRCVGRSSVAGERQHGVRGRPRTRAGPRRRPHRQAHGEGARRVPRPSLSARTSPPCISTRCRTIDKPEAEPAVRASASTRRPGGTSRTRSAGTPASMPMPVSLTVSSSIVAVARAGGRRRCPPRGVNLTAFESRFQITCCSRSGSPTSAATHGSNWPLDGARRAPRRPAASTPSRSSTSATRSSGLMSSRSLPLTMRDTSSRSSIEPRLHLRVALDLFERAIDSRPGARRWRAAAASSRGSR